MKTQNSFIWILLFFLMSCVHQDKKESNRQVLNNIRYNYKDCEWAKKEVEHDIPYQLMLISVGIPEESDNYFWTILKNEYDIGMKFGVGCYVDSGVSCYNDLMEKEIKNRFGSYFFDRVHFKIDSINEIDRPLIKKIKELNIIDTNHILRYEVFNTPNKDIKVVSGFGWRDIQDKIWFTNLFRISISRQKLKIISIDTTQIGVEPFKGH